jgi:serine/threonine protein kinase
LLKKLLRKNPKERPSAQESLDHPWIISSKEGSINSDEAIKHLTLDRLPYSDSILKFAA